MTAYLSALLTLSIIAHNKGSPIWKTSVHEATFHPVNVDLGGTMGTPAMEHKTGMPPVQQHTLPQSLAKR